MAATPSEYFKSKCGPVSADRGGQGVVHWCIGQANQSLEGNRKGHVTLTALLNWDALDLSISPWRTTAGQQVSKSAVAAFESAQSDAMGLASNLRFVPRIPFATREHPQIYFRFRSR